jgi:hypothetical protein
MSQLHSQLLQSLFPNGKTFGVLNVCNVIGATTTLVPIKGHAASSGETLASSYHLQIFLDWSSPTTAFFQSPASSAVANSQGHNCGHPIADTRLARVYQTE